MPISLLEAIVMLYNYKNKNKGKIYEIQFHDTTKVIRFGKQYSKSKKKWEYFVHETYAPCLCCTEENFIGKLANCKRIGFGCNTPPYDIIDVTNPKTTE